MTRTFRALRRVGTAGLTTALLVVAPLGIQQSQANHTSATNGAATLGTDLVFVDCVSFNKTTTDTTPEPVPYTATNNGAAATGSGCTTQAQVNTIRTLTVGYFENGQPVANRNVDFTIGANTANASFPANQPPSAQLTSVTGQTVRCTTGTDGRCSINVTATIVGNATITATEATSGQQATINVEFREFSTAAHSLIETNRQRVQPANDDFNGAFTDPNAPATSRQVGTPGRPLQVTYQLRDAGGTRRDANGNVVSTTNPQTLRNVPVTVSVNAPYFFTPNCGEVTFADNNTGATAPNATFDPDGAGPLPAGAVPDYRRCAFDPSPVNGAPAGELRSLGNTLNLTTDEGGRVTVTIAVERNEAFDVDGIDAATVTAVSGGVTVTGGTQVVTGGGAAPLVVTNTALPVRFTTIGRPLNGSTVDFREVSDPVRALSGNVPVANRDIGGNPETQRQFVVELTDQFNNLVKVPQNDVVVTESGPGVLTRFCSPCDPAAANTNFGAAPGAGVPATAPGQNTSGSFRNPDFTQDFFVLDNPQPCAPQPTCTQQPGTAGAETVTATWTAPVTTMNVTTTTTTVGTPPNQQTITTPTVTGFNRSTRPLTDSFSLTYYVQDPAQFKYTFRTLPSNTVNVGTVVTVETTVKDQFDNPVSGVFVDFFRGGANALECTNNRGTVVTDRLGRAGFSFTCNEPGNEVVSIVVRTGSGVELTRSSQTIAFTGSISTPSPSTPPTTNPTATPGTPTASPTGPGGPTCTAGSPLTVTLRSNVTQITAGNSPTLTGTVLNAGNQPCGNTQVTIFKQSFGEGAYTALATVTTDANGTFTLVVRPLVQTSYGANVSDAIRSNIVNIRVYTRVNILSPATTQVGSTAVRNPVTFSGNLFPGYGNVAVGLGTLVNGRFVVLQQTRSDANGNYTLTRTLRSGTGVYVIFVSAVSQGSDKGSKSITLSVS